MVVSWQDIAFGAGGFVLALALLPTLVSKTRPPRATSIMMLSVLAVFATAEASLALWIGTAGMIAQVVLWSIIAIRGPQ